ncbi:hypothetical protein Cgig2_025041 [Carnegiea gigantea]|uniref:Uncharacterized protein n=1 Tax=Carnegiea gigantea TaxID=171969 RepID=A0A9Q1GL49_9CARY|nr:hypothetical protein Cgig2_025041 [Carnegiea gigantea]
MPIEGSSSLRCIRATEEEKVITIVHGAVNMTNSFPQRTLLIIGVDGAGVIDNDLEITPHFNEDEAEDTPAKEEDDVKQEKEPSLHRTAVGDFQGNPVEVNSDNEDDDPNPINEFGEEPNKELVDKLKRDSTFEEEDYPGEPKPNEEEPTKEFELEEEKEATSEPALKSPASNTTYDDKRTYSRTYWSILDKWMALSILVMHLD